MWGELDYEEDGYIDDDDNFISNDKTSLRFRIRGRSPETIDEMLNTVVEFRDLLWFDNQ